MGHLDIRYLALGDEAEIMASRVRILHALRIHSKNVLQALRPCLARAAPS
jgi:hypothetical protein